ncbi:glycoside hydrolase family 99-like domain-containing protein [Trinickia soli]|uniref:glycoside hydrolase family 99-like domain-containing protein n=1 Tax=Trinickia soli TaxID=380675 RepID=UPI0012590057|nr:glycosyltransferase [Paraburkholderia sp. T12-10]
MIDALDLQSSDRQKIFQFLRWNCYRSEHHKLVYVATPKVACTSLKWWFATIVGYADALRGIVDSAESDPDLVVHESHKVAPGVTGLDESNLLDALTSDSYFRFAVVRNPYKRIFSAWQSKLLLREPLQASRYTQFGFFNLPVTEESDIAPAFEAFLEHLIQEEAPSFWDQHWTPQAGLLRPDIIKYSKIARIEESESLVLSLGAWLGDAASNPFRQRRANESLIPYKRAFLTERSAHLIRALYAVDFESFGYDDRPPEGNESFSREMTGVALKAVQLVRARHTQLGERYAHVARLNQAAHEGDAQIAALRQVVAENDVELASLRKLTTDSAATIAALRQSLIERDEKVVALEQVVVDWNVQAADLRSEIAERDARVAAFETTVAEKRREIQDLNAIVSERDRRIANLRRAVRERDTQVSESSRDLVERSRDIAGLRRAAVERSDEIERLSQALAERENLLSVRDAQIAQLGCEALDRDAQIAGLQRQIDSGADRDFQLAAANQRLDEIFRSRSWRLVLCVRQVATAARRVFAQSRSSFSVVRGVWQQKRLVRLVRSSGLFDAEFYLAGNPDVRSAGIDPATHYLTFGWREGRDPSAAFSATQYLACHPDVVDANVDPLTHYLRFGIAERRATACNITCAPEIVDNDSSAPGEAGGGATLAEGSILTALGEMGQPSDGEMARAKRIETEVEAIQKSGLFDERFYLSMYPELQISAADAIKDYCVYGWRAGRNPSDDFDTNYYRETYRDIRDADINPFWHYAIAGKDECRHAAPALSNRYEMDVWFGRLETDVKVIAFYATPDWNAVRSGRPAFKGHSQPILPCESLGYYDAFDPAVLYLQAQIAKRHGVDYFCFDLKSGSDPIHAQQPVESFLRHEQIDIGIIPRINASAREDADAIVELLTRCIEDRRQLRVEGRPAVIVSALVDEPDLVAAYLSQLQQRLAERGLRSPFWIGSGKGVSAAGQASPSLGLYDAVLDLSHQPVADEIGSFEPVVRNGVNVIPYSVVAARGIERICRNAERQGRQYNVVTLARDNSSGGSAARVIYSRFDAKDFRRWLDEAIKHEREFHAENERFVFINAWNDWNEGIALEPDKKTGFSRVNEVTRALGNLPAAARMPKVSVVVPNYRHAEFLRRRLDSIYGQTYKNIEVLLLDDCSPDDSRSVLDEYASAYPEITRKFYNTSNSGGVFRQWAKGINAAGGDLVWIAESDDYCDPEFLEKLVSCFEDESVLLAYGYSIFVDRNERAMGDEFDLYVSDLDCADKWKADYVETSHNEVNGALGIKNTIPNASSVVFRRPVDMPLLEDATWLSMSVAGDWVFYLHIMRGGRIAFRRDAVNFFRRYPGSTADSTYKKEVFYREVGEASRTVAELYDVSIEILERCRKGYESFYWKMVGRDQAEFLRWYDYLAVLKGRERRMPNVMITTMGFSPGGAEILPIRMVNELRRQGHSVLLLNTGLMASDARIRDLVRNDVPIVEASDVALTREIIRRFGIEVLNSHQWHVQKYPLRVPDVFDNLRVHVASLHGMIEHGEAFGATEEQLRLANEKVTTWVYTADKNLTPFVDFGLFEEASRQFVKIPNGLMPAAVVPVSRVELCIPEDAFVLCCVSRAIPDKGWTETIEAVGKARTLSKRDIRLVLVGNGPVYDEYCQHNPYNFVHFIGFSENSVGHYAAADMGIMLTKFKSESFPLTIVDCLFAGKPYIASDIGDIRNMLTGDGGIAGAVIELEDWEVRCDVVAEVIASFANNQQKYFDACKLVGAIATRYHIDMVTARYMELFSTSRTNNRLGNAMADVVVVPAPMQMNSGE